MNLKLISRYADGFANVEENVFLEAVNAQGKEQLALMRVMLKQAIGNDPKIVKKFELMKEADKKEIYAKSLRIRKVVSLKEGIESFKIKPLYISEEGFEYPENYLSLSLFNGKILSLTKTEDQAFLEVELEKNAMIYHDNVEYNIKNNGQLNVVKFDCTKSIIDCDNIFENSKFDENSFNEMKEKVENNNYEFFVGPRFNDENQVVGGYIFLLSSNDYNNIFEFQSCIPFIGTVEIQG